MRRYCNVNVSYDARPVFNAVTLCKVSKSSTVTADWLPRANYSRTVNFCWLFTTKTLLSCYLFSSLTCNVFWWRNKDFVSAWNVIMWWTTVAVCSSRML